uniref:Uncharacterized protein n=1 Tax=Glossina pallidipes TaxID=7398 RepID=A0A1A9ZGS2_GLOPL
MLLLFGHSSFDLQSLDHIVCESNSNEQPFDEVHRSYRICVGEHVPPSESDISNSFLLRAYVDIWRIVCSSELLEVFGVHSLLEVYPASAIDYKTPNVIIFLWTDHDYFHLEIFDVPAKNVYNLFVGELRRFLNFNHGFYLPAINDGSRDKPKSSPQYRSVIIGTYSIYPSPIL